MCVDDFLYMLKKMHVQDYMMADELFCVLHCPVFDRCITVYVSSAEKDSVHVARLHGTSMFKVGVSGRMSLRTCCGKTQRST